MGVASPHDSRDTFETFYDSHVREFASFLTRFLGSDAEEHGGRLSIEDALQTGAMRIYNEWPTMRDIAPAERDRYAYRCLRSAVLDALRSEYGRRGGDTARPWVSAYDFTALDEDEEDLPAREREMTAAVLGAIARSVAEDRTDERAMLDRAVLLAGLRVLTAREATVLVAVDGDGANQRALAERLGIDPGTVYEALFNARKLFYSIVRHAAGIEVDDEERARLYAYEDGELKGKEKRLARRHLRHCQSCQALLRERRRFGKSAHRVLSGLPFVLGGTALAKKSAVKGAAVVPASSASAAGKGLFAQAGAAKALGSTVAILAVGVGAGAWLSITHAPGGGANPPAGPATVSLDVAAVGAPLTAPKPHKKPAASKKRKSKPPHHATKKRKRTSRSSSSSSSSSATPQTSPPPTPVTPPTQTDPDTGGAGFTEPDTGGGGGSSSGDGGGTKGAQGEFFNG